MAHQSEEAIVGDKPFMADTEILLFSQILTNAQIYLEFGSGASTGFALNTKVKRIISVESDGKWLDRMRKDIRIRQACDLDRLQLLHVDIGDVGKWGFPTEKESASRWINYPEAPWPLLKSRNEAPDVILVDGRFRVACCLRTVLWWLEAGAEKDITILLHDVSDKRPTYQDVFNWCDLKARDTSLCAFVPKKGINVDSLRLAYKSASQKPI